MKKNHVPFVPALIAFGLLLVLTGCTDLFSPPPVTPVKTGVRIIVSDGTAARTLLPKLKEDSDYYFYELEIIKAGDTTPIPVPLEEGETEVTLVLDDGTWTITAYAFIKVGPEPFTNFRVAKGEAKDPIVIEDGEPNTTTPVEISISPLPMVPNVNGVKGTFTYNVTYDNVNDIDSAVLDILSYPGRTSVENVNLLAPPPSSSIDLPPGFYLMTVRLEKADRITTDRELVHIYSGMETVYSKDFKDDDFSDLALRKITAADSLAITPPVKDVTPYTTVTGIGTGYTAGAIEWIDDDDNTPLSDPDTFAAGTVYRAEFTLNAKPGYTFTGSTGTWKVNDKDVTPDPIDGNTIKITVVFDATDPAPTNDLTGISIKEFPTKDTYEVNDSVFVFAGLEITATYSITGPQAQPIVYDDEGTEIQAKFSVEGFVTTTAGTVPVKISFDGIEAPEPFFEITVVDTLKSISIKEFPTKDTYELNDSDFDLSGLEITATYITGPQTIVYGDDTKAKFSVEEFVTTTPGLVPVKIAFTEGTVTETATFTITVTTQITAGNLGITAPETDGTPDLNVTGFGYYGTITWEPDVVASSGTPTDGWGTITNDEFEAGIVYKATVTLSADLGYTFDGVEENDGTNPANSFTCDTADTVTHLAGSGTTLEITIVFPETE
jgi:hypothetical protein